MSNSKGSRKVYKRAKVQPCVLFEAQLVKDIDSLLEGAEANPDIAIQALEVLHLSCSVNDQINQDLF